MSEPKFKQGDTVKHRASGQRAVVIKPLTYCTVHRGMEELTAHVPRMTPPDPPCQFEFSGSYLISAAFEEEVEVPEYLLEPTGETESE